MMEHATLQAHPSGGMGQPGPSDQVGFNIRLPKPKQIHKPSWENHLNQIASLTVEIANPYT